MPCARVSAVLVVGAAAIGTCGAGAATLASTTPAPAPAPSAPWSVLADVPTTGTLDTAAYVSAAGEDLLVTAPTRSSDSDPSADSLVARLLPNGSRTVGISPRAVVGVIRKPGAAVRVISIRSTTNASARALAVSTLATDGVTLTATQRFVQHLPSINAAAFAQNAAGDGVLAWAESRTGADDAIERDRLQIRVATGRWGAFGSPRTVLDLRGERAAQVAPLAVDVNARGGFVVASDGACATGKLSACVYAWTGDARTGRIGRTISTVPSDMVGPLRAVLTEHGRAVLAWRNSNGDAMEPHGPVDVYATTVPRGASTFAPIQRVHRAPEDYPSSSGIDLVAVPGSGGATLLFSAPIGSFPSERGTVVYATTTNAAGRFGKRQVIVSKGGAGGLAVRADGATVATFTASAGAGTATLGARVRLPGASEFGPAESLGPLPPEAGLQPVTSQPRFGIGWLPTPDAPLPSFDPSTGRPLIAYTTAATKTGSGHVIVLARDRP